MSQHNFAHDLQAPDQFDGPSAHRWLPLNPSVTTLSGIKQERRQQYADDWDFLSKYLESAKEILKLQKSKGQGLCGFFMGNEPNSSRPDHALQLLTTDQPPELSLVQWLAQPAHPFYQLWLSFVHWALLNELAITLQACPQRCSDYVFLAATKLDLDSEPAPQVELTDTELLNWLEHNFFHRGLDAFDKQLHPGKCMWAFFAPDPGPGYRTIRQHLTNALTCSGEQPHEGLHD